MRRPVGFDFKKLLIQDYTLKVKEPPNPLPWEDQFIMNKYDLNLEWDLEFFTKHNFTNPKFMTLGVQTASGIELYRKDFTVEIEPAICYLHENKVNVKFESLDKPGKIVMYLFDEDKQWSDRYEKNI